MTISPGDFWIANIPFTDGSAAKKRPVLILWLDGRDTVVAAVTSAPPRTPTDIAVTDWQASGLRVPSTVRLSRLDCLEQSLLLARIGTVSPATAATLKATWQQLIQPQF
ncbi:MAG: type II toxin-antitoxin system PemK/MazF family toxin [Leptolyngbyaceae cyanobacterium]